MEKECVEECALEKRSLVGEGLGMVVYVVGIDVG